MSSSAIKPSLRSVSIHGYWLGEPKQVTAEGGMARRLVAFAGVLVGFVRGGLSLVNIMASTFFGAISGSSVADTASIGSVLIPEMEKQGYDKTLAAGITAATLAKNGFVGTRRPYEGRFGLYASHLGALAEACDVACDGVPPARWGAWAGGIGGLGSRRRGFVNQNDSDYGFRHATPRGFRPPASPPCTARLAPRSPSRGRPRWPGIFQSAPASPQAARSLHQAPPAGLDKN